MNVKDFLKDLRRDDIVAAIHAAEEKTSGEIRVFVSHKQVEDAVATATHQFHKLGMTNTRHRNGVLIFVAPKARKFAVIGDEAVHSQCGEVFWRELAAEMTGYFKQSDFTQGIIHGVRKAGELLAQHFQPGPDDANELPDKVEHD
jgi:uncharacterized membrane protein